MADSIVIVSAARTPIGGLLGDFSSLAAWELGAEAIRAANEELGVEIEHWQRTALAPAWQRTMLRAVAMATDSPTALVEARGLKAVWGSWSAPSEASQAQASLARVQAVPRLADTDVELERMGYSTDEIARIKAQWRRTSGRASVDALIAAGQTRAVAG